MAAEPDPPLGRLARPLYDRRWRYRRYVAVSPRVAGELEAYYKVPRNLISVIPNGIGLSKFKPDPAMRNVTVTNSASGTMRAYCCS